MTDKFLTLEETDSFSIGPHDRAMGLVFALARAYDPPPKTVAEVQHSFVYHDIYEPLIEAAQKGKKHLAQPFIAKIQLAATSANEAGTGASAKPSPNQSYTNMAELALIIACAHCAELVTSPQASTAEAWQKYAEANYWAGIFVGNLGTRKSEKEWRAMKSRLGTTKRAKNFDAKKKLVVDYAEAVPGYETLSATRLANIVIEKKGLGNIGYDTIRKHIRAWKNTLKQPPNLD